MLGDRKFSKLFEFLHYFYKRLYFGGYLGQNFKKQIQKFWNLRFGDWISMSIFSNVLTLFFFLIGQCHSGALKFISHRVINFEYCVMLYELIFKIIHFFLCTIFSRVCYNIKMFRMISSKFCMISIETEKENKYWIEKDIILKKKMFFSKKTIFSKIKCF